MTFYYALHHNLITVFFWLMWGHYMGDFVFQNDYMARAKNPLYVNPEGDNVWRHLMTAHVVIHTGFVALFTHSFILAGAEAIIHAGTDYAKCRKWINYHTDQFIHIGCKVVWAGCVGYGLT